MAQLLDRSTPDLAGLRAIGVRPGLRPRLPAGWLGWSRFWVARRWRWRARWRSHRLPRWARSGSSTSARGVAGGSPGACGRGACSPPLLRPRRRWPGGRCGPRPHPDRQGVVGRPRRRGGRPAGDRRGGDPGRRWSGARAAALVPVLPTLIGSVVAVMAVAMAVVFGASLTGLLDHPARYGWNWTLLMDTRGGYGSWAALADGQARQRPALGSPAGRPSRSPRFPSTARPCPCWG